MTLSKYTNAWNMAIFMRRNACKTGASVPNDQDVSQGQKRLGF